MTQKTLPDKPSELIRVALNDLKKIEKTKGYEVDMESWHDSYNSKCLVCLAGAVMVKSLKAEKNKSLFPVHFPTEREKLRVLNDLRMGEVSNGFHRLGIPDLEGKKFNRKIVYYHKNRLQFFADMEKLADDLEDGGF